MMSAPEQLASPLPASTDWLPIWNLLGGTPPPTPGCRVYSSVQQNFTANAWTTMSWDSESFDTDNMHDPATNPSRLTIRTAGWYEFVLTAYIAGAVGYQRVGRIIRNGAAAGPEILGIGQGAFTGYGTAMSTSYDVRVQATALWYMNPGDYVEAQFFSDVTAFSYAGGYSSLAGVLLGGAQGPAGFGVPTPVVNGQWIKGSGGAAVWSAIAAADIPLLGDPQLPDRLKTADASPLTADLNTCYSPGFVRWQPSSVNTPVASTYGYMLVVSLTEGNHQTRQIAWVYNSDVRWERSNTGSGWSTWVQRDPVPIGTSLPANPFDGQEFVLVDSLTNAAWAWKFRYNAGHTGTSYKWEFVGGAPYSGYTTANEPTSGGVYWKTNPSPGPLRAGIYTCTYWLTANQAGNASAYLDVYLGNGGSMFTPNFHRQQTGFNIDVGWFQPLPITVGANLPIQFYTAPTTWDYNITDRALTVIPRRVS